QSASGSVSATATTLVFGAIDFNSSAAAEEEVKNIAAAQHSGIKLDEVRFYDSALSSAEITHMYNYGKGDLAKVGGFSTAPSTIIGTAGVALSSTVAADFPNALYYAHNLPSGLSINSSTGEISGTPQVGGTHVISVLATGGTNESPKKASANITYSAPTSAPKFGAPGAANVLTSSALLLGEIELSGASSNTVDFVWDTSDQGTSNISDWNGSALAVGTGKEGFYGKQISDLSINTTYYYRNRATMALGPLDITNSLRLWVDASDLTSTPNPWTDKSGSGNDLSKSGTIDVVTNAQNGLNILRTDTLNNEYYYRNTSNLPAGDQTWMILYKEKASGSTNHSSGGILAYSWGSSYWRFESGSSNFNGRMRWRDGDSAAFKFTTGQMSTAVQWNLLAATFEDTGSGYTVKLWKNGTLHSTNSSGGDVLPDNGKIFVMRATNRGALGDYAEAVIFGSVDSTEIEKMEGYLAHKWGVTSVLPSGHTYKTTALTSTAWSDVQSFTTPTNISAPVLGAQSVANLDTTSADLEVVLSDNGNDATTITFYYGTTDGGTTASSWDSNLSFSNASEATIRVSATGLTSGQTYYFRALAKNSSSQNNGEDWANSSTAFTTVTSSVREDTEAVRYSDLKGWWKLDGNLLDSSGNNRHGTPPIIQTSSLWLDAADTSSNSIQLGSGNVQTWKDKSGNGHDASQSAGGSRPSPVANGLNGLQTLSFDGSADHLKANTFSLVQ
ncbi:Ig domain-containing protein, partial [Opitutales bacterium]|nr:Ig domain-containing protein [Opitutales bacterium]